MNRDKSDRTGLKGWVSASLLLFVFLSPSVTSAQHLRIFACAISNDSAGAFLGGSSRGSGLYQSDDTGKTWKHLGWDNIKCYSMDMIESSNGRVLYMATGLGVLRSTDYGEHWKQITDWRISEVMDIKVDPIDRYVQYIATAHGPWRLQEDSTILKRQGATITIESRIRVDDVPYCSRVIVGIINNETEAAFECASKAWKSKYGGISVYNPIEQDELEKSNLTFRNIWTLKSFLVMP